MSLPAGIGSARGECFEATFLDVGFDEREDDRLILGAHWGAFPAYSDGCGAQQLHPG